MSTENQEVKERPPEQEVYFLTAQFLGIENKLAPPQSPLEIHQYLSSGLPRAAITTLRRHFHVFIDEVVFAQALGMSLRTMQRLKAAKGKPLSSEQSSRAWKFAEILARATSVLGAEEAAEEWLSKPARALQGEKPIELLTTQTGTQVVEDLLEQMDYGVYV
jgi:putative toxin-antitoxin system antitoxin component (TIGR02293 family)